MSGRLEIHGGQPLDGTVTISGSKNATLPAMAAALALPGGLLLDRKSTRLNSSHT